MGAMIKSNLMQALDQNSIQTCMEILKLEPQKVNEKVLWIVLHFMNEYH